MSALPAVSWKVIWKKLMADNMAAFMVTVSSETLRLCSHQLVICELPPVLKTGVCSSMRILINVNYVS